MFRSKQSDMEEVVKEALLKMVSLYESEYDSDATFARPQWLVEALDLIQQREVEELKSNNINRHEETYDAE